MNKNIVIGIIVLLVAVGGSFYGGMKYAEGQSPRGGFQGGDFANLSAEERQARFGQAGGMGPGGMGVRGGNGLVSGEIISKDEQSFTIKLQDGGSRIVLFSESTTVSKTAPATVSDLAVGEQVVVMGESNQDGSVTAQNVQLGATPRVFTPSDQSSN